VGGGVEGNDDEAICAPASGEGKSRLLCRAPHPASPLRTPRNDTNWVFLTVPVSWGSGTEVFVSFLIIASGLSSEKIATTHP
jgi:hypothetical protein